MVAKASAGSIPEEGAVIAGADPSGQRRRAGPKPDDDAVGEGGPHDGIEHHPSRGGEHGRCVVAQGLEHDV